MKISNIQTSLCLGLAFCLLATSSVDAQGLFNRKKKEISPTVTGGSLFPDATYQASSSPTAPSDSPIFKSGQPQSVSETDYEIRDGEKVEKKRLSFFQNRRKLFGNSNNSSNNDTPEFATPVATPADATVVTSPDRDSLALNSTPAPTVKKEKPFGLPSLPFFRKDDEPIDTSRAEVLVNNDGVLTTPDGATGDDFRFTNKKTTTSSSENKTPPREENGSIVYNSWDDVSARRTSAADQIVRDMKAQEAAHRKKIEAAKREYEEKRKKAEADARIRAIMQGAMIPPSGGL